MHANRCCVCDAVVSYSEKEVRSAQYCPDKVCCLYPPSSRAEDPSLPAYVLTLVDATSASARGVSAALGENRDFARNMALAERKRWQGFS